MRTSQLLAAARLVSAGPSPATKASIIRCARRSSLCQRGGPSDAAGPQQELVGMCAMRGAGYGEIHPEEERRRVLVVLETDMSARYRRRRMSSEGPLRSRAGDAASTGWRVVLAEGTTTELRRPSLVSGRGLLLVFPITFAIACGAWLLGLSFVLPPLGALGLVVAMLWPLSEERLSVTARHVRWKDRALGARFRASLRDTRLVTRSTGSERALLLADGRTEQLLAMAAPEDVDAFIEVLHDALTRAREESARRPRHSERR